MDTRPTDDDNHQEHDDTDPETEDHERPHLRHFEMIKVTDRPAHSYASRPERLTGHLLQML
jgi:hypothetical protein